MGPLEVSDPPPTRKGPQKCLLDDLFGSTPIPEKEHGEAAQAVIVREEQLGDLFVALRCGVTHDYMAPEMYSRAHSSMCHLRQPNSHTLHDARGTGNVARQVDNEVTVPTPRIQPRTKLA